VCAGREKGWNLEGDGGRRGGIWALTGMVGVGYDAGMSGSNFLSSIFPTIVRSANLFWTFRLATAWVIWQ